MRTTATFSPPAARSTAKTVPRAGASRRASGRGRYAVMPAVSSRMPSPVRAEPNQTGCSSPAAVWRASSRRTSPAGGTFPSTSPASTASSCSASTSAACSRTSRRSSGRGTDSAAAVPACRTAFIGTGNGASFRRMSASSASGLAPARSILLTKRRVGSRRFRSERISTRVCAWTPSTADSTSTAPSSTASARSTSAMKSGWPGVSTRLTWRSPTPNAATAERMVMPRSRSSSPESVCVFPASTLPSDATVPWSNSSRSVRLVLPASTWARMPRFRVSGTEVLGSQEGGVRQLDNSEVTPHLVLPAPVALPNRFRPEPRRMPRGTDDTRTRAAGHGNNGPGAPGPRRAADPLSRSAGRGRRARPRSAAAPSARP